MQLKSMKLAVLSLCTLLLVALVPFASAEHNSGPLVEVGDQVIFDATVNIDKAIMIEPGWIVIHADDGTGTFGPVIGQRLLSPGSNYNIDVPINANATTSTLYAMLHFDTGAMGVYEFGTVDGADLPVTDADGNVVSPSFSATVAHVHDQLIDGNMYHASSVTVDAPSWLVVHAGDEASFGAVLGQTLVQPGTTADVMVELAADGRTEILWPMLHVDDGAMGVYEFGAVEGADGPIVVNDEVATAPIWTTPHIRVADQIVTRGDGMDMNAAPTLAINSVLAADAGWLVVHQEQDGSFGPVAGLVAVPAGLSHGPNAVTVELDPAMLTNNLWPMLHVDDGEIGVYEFGTVEGADNPVAVNGNVVTYPIAAAPSIVYAGTMPTADSLIIEQAIIDAPGWLVIHQDDGTGNFGAAIGQTQIAPGVNNNVVITFEDPNMITDTIFPMLHYDTNAVGEYEFGTVEGADSPVVVGGNVVTAAFSFDGTVAEPMATEMPEATATEEAMAAGTIVDIAVADGRFTMLVAAVQAAGLVDVLADPNANWTVFAPTDDAFAALPAGTVDMVLQDTELLTRILTYHVVEGRVTSDQISDMMAPSMEMTAPGAPLMGSELDVQVADDGSVTVNGANVIIADIIASNGVIHVIDQVLLPPDVMDMMAAMNTGSDTTTTSSGSSLMGTVSTSASAVNVRSGASMDSEIVTTVPTGTTIEIMGRSEDSGWVMVSANGTSGWIATDLVTVDGDISALAVMP